MIIKQTIVLKNVKKFHESRSPKKKLNKPQYNHALKGDQDDVTQMYSIINDENLIDELKMKDKIISQQSR